MADSLESRYGSDVWGQHPAQNHQVGLETARLPKWNKGQVLSFVTEVFICVWQVKIRNRKKKSKENVASNWIADTKLLFFLFFFAWSDCVARRRK